MNTHKNARLTFVRRLELAQCIIERGVAVSDAASRHGVSVPTARKWASRYRERSAAGLADLSSRPHRSPRCTGESTAIEIIGLRQSGATMDFIARAFGCSISTVSRICSEAGLSRLPRPHSIQLRERAPRSEVQFLRSLDTGR